MRLQEFEFGMRSFATLPQAPALQMYYVLGVQQVCCSGEACWNFSAFLPQARLLVAAPEYIQAAQRISLSSWHPRCGFCG